MLPFSILAAVIQVGYKELCIHMASDHGGLEQVTAKMRLEKKTFDSDSNIWPNLIEFCQGDGQGREGGNQRPCGEDQEIKLFKSVEQVMFLKNDQKF